MSDRFESVQQVRQGLRSVNYLADDGIAGVAFLADRLGKPVLVEGPAGVGKTELAKVVSKALGRNMIRLQCYEGLDEAKALYEWEYSKQLLYTQILKDKVAETSPESRPATVKATTPTRSTLSRSKIDHVRTPGIASSPSRSLAVRVASYRSTADQ